MDNQTKLRDCIVIGAGVSGLSAAKFLKDKGLNDILVLEANDRVGGRTYTVHNDKVTYVDLGGAYIGPTQNYLYRMLEEFDIQTYKIDETTDTFVYDIDTNLRTKIAPQAAFKIGNFIESLDINNFLRKLDQIGDEINVKEPWNSKNALKWDRMTYQDLIDKTCYTNLGKKFAKCFINLNVTCEPYEASVLWFCWYIRQCGGVKRIVSTTGGGQESKTIGGMQQLSIKMAERIGNEKIKLNDAVLKIKYDAELNKTKCCQVSTHSGKEYFAKKVILALPPINQGKIHYTPALPPMRTQLNQRYPMGTVIKSIIYYEIAFWKDLGCCGSVLQLGSKPEDAPLFYTLDDTKPDGSKPALIGFILADRLRALINKTKQERCNLIAKSLYNVFNHEMALKPCHYEEHTMLNEQYIGGCYTAYAPPGFLTNFGPILRKPIDNKIYFAGTETSFNWSGYINGAIDAGERAAREVLVGFGKLKPNEIWVEEPYLPHYPRHEFKDSIFDYAPSPQTVVRLAKHVFIGSLIAGVAYLHIKKGWCPIECLKKN